MSLTPTGISHIFSGLKSTSKSSGELVALFDIGSSSVGGALFYNDKKEGPKIIFSIREPVAYEENIDFDRFLASVIKSLTFVANKIGGAGLGAPKRFFCVLSSPWYASQTRNISLSKNTPFIFNTKLADELTAKEVTQFQEQHLAEHLNSPNKVRAIELRTMQTMLNGYVTGAPVGQKAKDLGMTIFISMSPEQVLVKIEEVIAGQFHTKEIKFSSFAMTSFAVARDVLDKEDNFLLVDIGGEVTDISMVKHGILRESISYPMGHHYMVRGVAATLGCSLDEAKSFISLYKDGHAEEATHKKLEEALGKLKTEWLKKFQESLANVSNDISIPSTLVVSTVPELTDFFSETIKAEEFNQYALTDTKFKLNFLSTQVLHGSVTFAENVARDSFLLIEAVYINRYLQ